MYWILLVSWYVVSYLFFSIFLQLFFQKKIEVTIRFIHIISIFLLLFLMLLWVQSIPSPEWWNRFQHAFWGGFLIVFILFLSQKVSKVTLTKFQFISLGILFATLFWVWNEVLEYFLQEYFDMIFTYHLYDTWLDLISNTVWAIIWVSVFSLFLQKNK